MERLQIEKTLSTPEVDFDPFSGKLKMQGESYPENAAKFYQPVLQWIEEYFASNPDNTTVLEMEIVYFNSSTSKIFMSLFDDLEVLSHQGIKVKVDWICSARNETAIECGEEFKEDLDDLSFDIIVKED